MLSNRRLREEQKEMRARQPNKPWTFTNDENAERTVVRMRVMIESGLSDQFIGDALGIGSVLVSIFRTKKRPSR
jgi:hypothetical protein